LHQLLSSEILRTINELIMPSYTEFDSSLSLAMLDVALENQQIELVLTEIATRLRNAPSSTA
jgi:hypothetical protein